MRERVKKIAKTTGVYRLYKLWWDLIDSIRCYHIECSIADILLQRDVPYMNQLLLASRLLDIEAYLEKGDTSFRYQNMISFKAYGGPGFDEKGTQSFMNLIDSYKKNGYRSDSYVTCDNAFELVDGNHRMGLHIYEGIERVNVRVLKRKIPYAYSSDWYFEVGLPSSFMEEIYHRYDLIQSWLVSEGMAFCAIIPPAFKEIGLAQDMRYLATVLDVKHLKSGVRIILFSMPCPNYVVINNRLISKRAVAIEKILKTRYGECSDGIIVSKNCLEGKQIYSQYMLD